MEAQNMKVPALWNKNIKKTIQIFSFHLNPVVQIVLVGAVDKGSASFDEA